MTLCSLFLQQHRSQYLDYLLTYLYTQSLRSIPSYFRAIDFLANIQPRKPAADLVIRLKFSEKDIIRDGDSLHPMIPMTAGTRYPYS